MKKIKLSNKKIEEKIAGYEDQLNKLPEQDFSYKRQYIAEKLSELKKKFQLWKDRQIDDDSLQNLFDKIEDWFDGFEFTNRIRELETITNPFSPPVYQLISAPMGYGKTRLLEIAQMILKKQGWHCILLTLSQGRIYSIRQFTLDLLRELKDNGEAISDNDEELGDAQTCGQHIGITVANFFDRFKQSDNPKEKICLLVDQAERLDSPHEKKNFLVAEIFNTVLPAFSKVMTAQNQNIKWRFIFSGRYISEWEHRITGNNISIRSYELKLFDPATIAETIENYAKEKGKDPSYETIQNIASLTLHFTGGHPKCMVPIIKDGLELLFKHVIANETQYYDETMPPVIEDIKANLPPKIYRIAETLSVVRKISRFLLEHFIQEGLINGYSSKFDVEEKLLGTFLFRRKKHFLEDAIVRKILAIHLRHYNVSLFKQICDKAIECYLETLKNAKSLEPAMLAVELLYLELQSFCAEGHAKPEVRAYFKERLHAILEIVQEHRDKTISLEVIEGIKELFIKDQELKLNLRYLADADTALFETIINDDIQRLRP